MTIELMNNIRAPYYKPRNKYEQILRWLALVNEHIDEYYDRIWCQLDDTTLIKMAAILGDLDSKKLD